ncbi:MAG: T9SS type A sorting domain-containing protein [Bacteroidetes bacterium]|nr:T9SS type A sorting domain-containing protein [Bacteroidota bacterium]
MGDFESTETGILVVVPIEYDALYLSTNGGASWEHRTDLDSLLVRNVEVSDTDLFILTDHRLYRVPDFGTMLVEVPAPTGEKIGTFCVSRTGKVYITLADNPLTDFVCSSTDFGATWVTLGKKFSDLEDEDALTVDAQDQIWSHDPWAVARLDRQSGTWSRYDQLGFGYSNLPRVFFRDDGTIYVNNGSAVMKCDPSTGSTVTIYTPPPGRYGNLQFLRMRNGTLLASYQLRTSNLRGQVGSGVLVRSLDDGATWTVVDSLHPHMLYFHGESSGAVYCSYFGIDLVRSFDLGGHFADCMQGIHSKDARRFETRNGRIHVHGPRYALSSDAGISWSYPNFARIDFEPHDFCVTGDGVFYDSRVALFISRDSAKSWEQTGLDTLTDILAADDVILASEFNGPLYRSSDKGRTWDLVLNTGVGITHFTDFDGVIYGITDTRLLISSDRGLTWQQKPIPTYNLGYDVLGVNSRMLFLATHSRRMCSTDRGDTWTEINHLPFDGDILALATSSDGTFAAITAETPNPMLPGPPVDVIVSTDDGRTWTSIAEGLPTRFFEYPPSTVFRDIAFLPNNTILVAVPGRGLYAYDGIPVKVEDVPAPTTGLQLVLRRNVTATSIECDVQSDQKVRMAVFDMLGHRRAEFSLPSGTTHPVIDVGTWPSGTYLLRAATSTESVTKRFVVLR